MKKILLGALVAAAVAGVVYYLYDPETFNETVGDLKDKANDMYGKAKDMMGKQADKAMSGAMS
jgi:gas vesicle protein